jgi:CBS domain-containing protein
MLVREAMTGHVEYIPSSTTLKQAAEKMRELDCGFLPLGDAPDGKLLGVITDRDIVIRGIAKGLDPVSTTVDRIKSEKVLYCFKDDKLADAAHSMHDKQVYRLVVLNNKQEKKLCGVISLGDITRHHEVALAAEAVEGIVAAA